MKSGHQRAAAFFRKRGEQLLLFHDHAGVQLSVSNKLLDWHPSKWRAFPMNYISRSTTRRRLVQKSRNERKEGWGFSKRTTTKGLVATQHWLSSLSPLLVQYIYGIICVGNGRKAADWKSFQAIYSRAAKALLNDSEIKLQQLLCCLLFLSFNLKDGLLESLHSGKKDVPLPIVHCILGHMNFWLGS